MTLSDKEAGYLRVLLDAESPMRAADVAKAHEGGIARARQGQTAAPTLRKLQALGLVAEGFPLRTQYGNGWPFWEITLAGKLALRKAEVGPS